MTTDNSEEVLGPEQAQQVLANARRLMRLHDRYALQGASAGTPSEILLQMLLRRARYTFKTAMEIGHRFPDCAVLVRVLYEHVLAYSWIAIDPEPHYRRFLRSEREQLRKAANHLRNYTTLVPTAEDIESAMGDLGEKGEPSAADLAKICDQHWPPLVPDWSFNFDHGYAGIFRLYSNFVHPSESGLRTPHSGLPPAVLAVLTFADALAVTSAKFGWPPLGAVARAMVAGVDGFEEDPDGT